MMMECSICGKQFIIKSKNDYKNALKHIISEHSEIEIIRKIKDDKIKMGKNSRRDIIFF
jgi:hypothetical protein